MTVTSLAMGGSFTTYSKTGIEGGCPLLVRDLREKIWMTAFQVLLVNFISKQLHAVQ
jgi:hypothetical protein